MWDALVVGAGPTGLTMASELARHGLRCRLVEQLEAPSVLSRALAVQARTLEVFDDFGIVEQALARGRKVEALNVVGAGGVHTRVPMQAFSWLETRYPFIFMLPQDATEALLTEYLGTLGVKVERGLALEDFRQDAAGVEATLKRAEGGVERVKARWLLGCDGARSRVRKGAGIPFEGETYDDACVLADVRVEWPLGQGELVLMPSMHGVVGAFPMPGEQRYRLFAVMPRDMLPEGDETTPLSLEEMQRILERMSNVPVRVSEPRWLTRYRLHRRGVPRYRQGHVFLAGDAAHIHSPAGGQGMNTGIQDAYNLAWKLALVTKGRAPDSLLDTYELERHPVGQLLLEGTDRAFGLMTRGGTFSRLLRTYVAPRMAKGLLGSSFTQRRMARFVTQLAIHYRRSPLSTERIWGEEVGGVRLEEGPAPGERVPELPVKGEGVERLHEVLRGPQHTLLLFTGSRPEAKARGGLVALARRLEEAYGPLLRARVVVAGEGTPGPFVLADGEGALHRRFGAGAECFYLVRPDGYVGHRERPIEPKRLEAELARRLGPPGPGSETRVAS
ncbi:2-polyprenyl-6-methoxyphenol hydroxylase-like FAD-dependent oxidoreductase [Archangium gephyra]|uniref:2-polyprenyl-6-methoxyphenol hydroxylase n=1 Tax=Archangium gephyra TaxID=48 RepID=A0AAC8QIK1_9BACT|nr:FAD-dependent monooxygenase [Archangium gephyra]AKJ07775.1 2-polyprenyl-6-methoxyphenol hydroxylase [Archangium gephyra]REG29528.1 2-polyprenyl-6-methoxyphenol hydroxylase-like FAD-dependent oxidoreductase [Archangium gephyra]